MPVLAPVASFAGYSGLALALPGEVAEVIQRAGLVAATPDAPFGVVLPISGLAGIALQADVVRSAATLAGHYVAGGDLRAPRVALATWRREKLRLIFGFGMIARVVG